MLKTVVNNSYGNGVFNVTKLVVIVEITRRDRNDRWSLVIV